MEKPLQPGAPQLRAGAVREQSGECSRLLAAVTSPAYCFLFCDLLPRLLTPCLPLHICHLLSPHRIPRAKAKFLSLLHVPKPLWPWGSFSPCPFTLCPGVHVVNPFGNHLTLWSLSGPAKSFLTTEPALCLPWSPSWLAFRPLPGAPPYASAITAAIRWTGLLNSPSPILLP